MLPEKTYLIRFAHRDSSEIEEQEYTRAEDGWEVYRMFAGPDCAEMYTRIELVEYDWHAREEHLLAAIEFDAPEYTGEPWEEEYTPSCTAGDYGPGNPWDAPGMSIHDFI